jgi:hypothetical protein
VIAASDGEDQQGGQDASVHLHSSQ